MLGVIANRERRRGAGESGVGRRDLIWISFNASRSGVLYASFATKSATSFWTHPCLARKVQDGTSNSLGLACSLRRHFVEQVGKHVSFCSNWIHIAGHDCPIVSIMFSPPNWETTSPLAEFPVLHETAIHSHRLRLWTSKRYQVLNCLHLRHTCLGRPLLTVLLHNYQRFSIGA